MNSRQFFIWFIALDLLIVGAIGIWLIFKAPEPDNATTNHRNNAAHTQHANATTPAVIISRPLSTQRVADALPPLASRSREFHGDWRGETVWVRLLAANAAQRGRIVQLLWTPPAQDALGGTFLDDCPDLMLDERGRFLRYESRGKSHTFIKTVGSTTGYLVRRDLTRHIPRDPTHPNHDAIRIDPLMQINEPFSWERNLLPVHLALSWHESTSATVSVLNLLSAGAKKRALLRWNGPQIRMDDVNWTATADQQGRLARLTDERGEPILVIRAWTIAD